MKYKDIPCIKDKAYFIIVSINGSWLYNALYPNIQDEEFCRKIVESFESDYSVDDWTEIQEYIDDTYNDILTYRLEQSLQVLNE